jgi:amino acid transporter
MSLSSSRPTRGSPAEPGLRPHYLSLPEIIAQSVGTIAPSAALALSIGVVFGAVGNGTWLAYVFATIIVLFVASSINQFARRGASAGALYVFAGKGLGLTIGVITGWSLFLAYLFTAAAMVCGSVNYLMILVHDMAGIAGGRDLAVGVSIIVVGLAWALAYRNIRLSTRTILWIEAATITLTVLVVIGSIAAKGPALDPAQLRLDDVIPDELRRGLVIAFFGFVGFESATVLGDEARRPLLVIPRAIILSVIAAGLIFVVSAYGLVGAYHGIEPDLDRTAAPLDLLARNIDLAGVGTIIAVGVVLSFFACVLGNLNAAARVLFALSRHGLVHPLAGRAHPINATPYVALTLLAAIALGLSLCFTVFGIALIDSVSYLGGVAIFGFLLAYIFVVIAAPAYLRRIGALEPRHVAVAAITVLLLAIPLIGVLYPVAQGSRAIPLAVFIVLIAIGFARFWLVERRSPQELLAIRADFLGEAVAPDGDV